MGSAAVERVVDALEGATSVRELMERAKAALRRAVAFDASGFRVTDPETMLWTDAIVEAPGNVGWRFIENELLDEDYLKYSSLAQGMIAGSLSSATKGDLARSRRHRTILSVLELGDELRATLMADGVCWGTACLSRRANTENFSASEVALVKSVAPRLALALRARLLTGEAVTLPDGPPGTVLLRADDTILAVTDPAKQWLAQLAGDNSDELPAAARAVATRARAAAAGRPGSPASARVRTREGTWFELHAAPLLDSTGTISVTIAPAPAGRVMPLLLASFDLSSREREVLALLLRGRSTEQIGQELFISRHTVRDHTKAIFAKTCVRSRPELVARVLATLQ